MSTRFTALTIKEGDAFLLEDNGWNCLFDSGKDNLIVNLLKHKGIEKLDLAICSHNDADHANGFISILQSNIKIDEIWLPSFWLSILQYVQEHGIDWTEIDRRNEEISKRMKKGLNPKWIFSDDTEPITNDESNYTLSWFAERSEYDFDRQFHNIVRCVIKELDQIDVVLPEKAVYTVAECVIDNLINDIDQRITKILIKHVIFRLYQDLGNDYTKYGNRRIREALIDMCHGHEFVIKSASSVKECKKIKEFFGNIRNLAVLARCRGCKIRWFEPTQACTINDVQNSNFIALNSDECQVSKLQDNIVAFALALHLTEVNEYSLVFEYLKDDIPIIRFSADSDCTCQSSFLYPYSDDIIVTAPHHGSEANEEVYMKLQGDDIIWVRSDTVTGGTGKKPRPCDAFKSMKNKYCLACETFNFISEICFEYDPCQKKWQHIRGEQCRCKPEKTD